MDTVLIVLASAKNPVLASEIADYLKRDPNNVRSTLQLLHEAGLAQKVQVGTRGPIGTFKWLPTEAGRACVSELIAFIRSEGA